MRLLVGHLPPPAGHQLHPEHAAPHLLGTNATIVVIVKNPLFVTENLPSQRQELLRLLHPLH